MALCPLVRCILVLTVVLGACVLVVRTDAQGAQAGEAPGELHAAPHGDSSTEHQQHDEHGGAANPLTIDPDLAIFTAVVFLALLAVLWIFAWRPIYEALDRRERGIAEQMEGAERSSEQAKQLLAQHQARLNEAAEEVRGLLDQARRDAESEKQRILADAQQAARDEKERAVREISDGKDQAIRDLATKSVDTAVDLAGRIVRRQLRREDHADLIEDALGGK